MSFQPVLIDGTWRQARLPVGSFTAVNPTTKTPLTDRFPVSNFSDIELALSAAHQTVIELQDKNPTGEMWRFIDGEWTKRDV